MKFSEKLIELRKRSGLSQEELGNRINVSRQAISKWESGQSNPEIDKVKDLSKVFNVSIDYLLDNEHDVSKAQTLKTNKKKMWKIILTIFLVLLSIYLLTVIYKFAVLLTFSIKANNIADYDSYSISINTFANDRLHNDTLSTSETITYHNNTEVSESYDSEGFLDFEQPTTITYMNSKDKKAYSLSYDSEINKYILQTYTEDDETSSEEIYTHTTIRDVTKEYIPTSIGEIFLLSIDPHINVTFDEDLVNISSYYKNVYQKGDLYQKVSINKYTGIVDSTYYTSNNNLYVAETYFDYTFEDRFNDDYLLDEMYLDDIEYVLYEDLYSE